MLKNIGTTAALSLAIFGLQKPANTIPQSSDNSNTVATCKSEKVKQNKVLNCLPPKTVEIVITQNGMIARDIYGKTFKLSDFIGTQIQKDENGQNYIKDKNGQKIRVSVEFN